MNHNSMTNKSKVQEERSNQEKQSLANITRR